MLKLKDILAAANAKVAEIASASRSTASTTGNALQALRV